MDYTVGKRLFAVLALHLFVKFLFLVLAGQQRHNKITINIMNLMKIILIVLINKFNIKFLKIRIDDRWHSTLNAWIWHCPYNCQVFGTKCKVFKGLSYVTSLLDTICPFSTVSEVLLKDIYRIEFELVQLFLEWVELGLE